MFLYEVVIWLDFGCAMQQGSKRSEGRGGDRTSLGSSGSRAGGAEADSADILKQGQPMYEMVRK